MSIKDSWISPSAHYDKARNSMTILLAGIILALIAGLFFLICYLKDNSEITWVDVQAQVVHIETSRSSGRHKRTYYNTEVQYAYNNVLFNANLPYWIGKEGSMATIKIDAARPYVIQNADILKFALYGFGAAGIFTVIYLFVAFVNRAAEIETEERHKRESIENYMDKKE